jgi:hypothetical protein
MAQEFKIHSWFEGIKESPNYVDSTIACSIAMEYLLSKLLFKDDLSRVVYSKDDIAFRRRVELVGVGKVDGEQQDLTSLELPFANYSQVGSLEPDDRVAAMSAAQIVPGRQIPDIGISLRSAATQIKYQATAWFGRRDDVGIASQLLYWEMQPTFPLYVVTRFSLAGYPIDIPAFITIDSFDSNPEYQEKEWLTQSKLFPVKIDCTIRTYQTLIEQVDKNGMLLPLRFTGIYDYNTDLDIYFTHDCSLIWADTKWTPASTKKEAEEEPTFKGQLEPANSGAKPWAFFEFVNNTTETIDVPANSYTYENIFNSYKIETKRLTLKGGDRVRTEKVEATKYGYDKDLRTGVVAKPQILPSLPPGIELFVPYDDATSGEKFYNTGEEGLTLPFDETKNTVADVMRGYFEAEPTMELVEYSISEATDDSLTIRWKVKPGTEKDFDHVDLYCPGVINRQIFLQDGEEIKIDDLCQCSEYEFTLVLMSRNGGARTYRLVGKTTGSPIVGEGVSLRSQLLGRTFTNRPV